jgi:hypothetical protein
MQLDKELQADVIRELAWEPKVDAALRKAAESAPGVTKVDSMLTITP